MKGIGVLVSGGGTNLQAIMDAIDRGEIPAKINLVLSNRADAYGLVRAQNSGISTCYLNRKKYADSEAYHQAMLSQLKAHDVEYIVLAGYLYILSPELVEYYRNRIINIHPSLIPAFCGMGLYGQKVHQAVLDYGAKITGATVHFVDEGADTGPIILQKAIEVLPDDTAESLGSRVLKVEHELLPKAVSLLVQDKIKVSGRRVSFEE
ncbi:MAG: phosphoribosylglycinamide formyltransferase [Clostridia bacterium]|nr:phosphoribosylglycinamide formyltransferase [Clostridia bacterium]MDD4679495.1 phosphoribosylglycinamide formyltransferase [Clostridia bacterium]